MMHASDVGALRPLRWAIGAAFVGASGLAWGEVSVTEERVAENVESEEISFDVVQIVSGLEHP
ncbi:hypothetical protein [Vreelandella malpeensis]|uniref:hypothetical protein n=1 Tax=Vreelandella malpeensis TaxID=1172368 RepID=UPI001D0A9394|nr:hypothetical protein [Halomonas malpeensis]